LDQNSRTTRCKDYFFGKKRRILREYAFPEIEIYILTFLIGNRPQLLSFASFKWLKKKPYMDVFFKFRGILTTGKKNVGFNSTYERFGLMRKKIKYGISSDSFTQVSNRAL